VALYTATWCGPTRWPPRVEVGTVRYDAVRAQACADDWATRSCGEVSTEPASCQRFLVPAVPLQGRCYDGYAECIDGVCRGGGCPRRCLARGGVGEACLAMSDCAAGLSCRPGASGSGQCAALGAEGEACGLSLACGPGLVCVGASCRRLPPAGEACLQGRCDDGAYCSTGADGGSCEARRDAGVGCVDDAECLPSLVCDATARTCVVAQVAAPGDECSPGQRCPAGTVCLIEANASTGTCGAPRDDGAPCERAGDCASHLTCLPGDGGQACRARNADGAPCTVTRDCLAFSACVAGTCVALPTLGRPCAADRPCLWGTCLDGPDGGAVCAEAQGPGQSCRSASDCASGRCEQGFCTAACLP
jgi:hypothetical protein